jgi:hypothetical protein
MSASGVLSSTVGGLSFNFSGMSSSSFRGTVANVRDDILAKALESTSKTRPASQQQRTSSPYYNSSHSKHKTGRNNRQKLAPARSLESLLLTRLTDGSAHAPDQSALLKVDLLRSLRSMQTHTTKVSKLFVSGRNPSD